MKAASDRAVESQGRLEDDWEPGRLAHLMPRRVGEILLVASEYDAFILEEDGLLNELIFSEYSDLGLTNAPRVTRASTGEAALEMLRSRRYDLVITMMRLGGLKIADFGRAAREIAPGVPIVLLIASELDLPELDAQASELFVDDVFVWHGDAKLFLAIIKAVEDLWNVEHDTREGSVGVIILIEDSRRYRSSLLPKMYAELVQQTRSVMADSINRMHKLLRMRARPKILLANTFEQGIQLYQRYREHIFGVIVDVRFPRNGVSDPLAGIDFVRYVKADNPDIPALVQSSEPRNRTLAESVGGHFIHKRSSTLLIDLRTFMLDNFGFGDFQFKLPDGTYLGHRASDLRSMIAQLAVVPAESLDYHAKRNHFSNWLRARTEFALARKLRPRKRDEFNDAEALRRYLITAFSEALRQNRRGVVEAFKPETFDANSRFARIGGGSLGGKARGLAFIDALLGRHNLEREFEGVRIFVPRSVIIGADVFEEFLARHQLRSLALLTSDDARIAEAFLQADLPESLLKDLRAYLEQVRTPIAVRSSSLLEDSQHYPFAGIYETRMLPNNHPDDAVRLKHLCDAVRLVYASTFSAAARQYLESTPHRVEEQQMALTLQPVVGLRRENYFYPSFAGVARSYNFYPFGEMRPEDGVASVGLGLGRLIVEGGEALRFCPAHPHILPQLEGDRFIQQSQRGFYAIDLSRPDIGPAFGDTRIEVRLGLDVAERHGTLAPVGSVWSEENQALYDGIHRPGVRVITFAHVLKSDLFPLAPLLQRVLALGQSGLNGPIEMEFAVNLDIRPMEFAVLQIRPFVAGTESETVEIDAAARPDLALVTDHALGNGVLDNLRDVVYIRPEKFDTANTVAIARQIAEVNAALRSEDRPYLLIGPGRWGSSNHWLGIPVTWAQISFARVIVETTLAGFTVDPSQGSHFFQNLTSFGIPYLTVDARSDGSFIDWAWLDAQPAVRETEWIRHVRLSSPIEVRVDGRRSRAIVLKRARRPMTLADADRGA